jgi:hypothetical protein
MQVLSKEQNSNYRNLIFKELIEPNLKKFDELAIALIYKYCTRLLPFDSDIADFRTEIENWKNSLNSIELDIIKDKLNKEINRLELMLKLVDLRFKNSEIPEADFVYCVILRDNIQALYELFKDFGQFKDIDEKLKNIDLFGNFVRGKYFDEINKFYSFENYKNCQWIPRRIFWINHKLGNWYSFAEDFMESH